MRIHLGSDHAGFELKQQLVARLAGRGHDVVDHGPSSYRPDDDYPVFCLRAGEGVAADLASGRAARGIVIGGSGNGEQLAANKVAGIRAALVWSEQTAEWARAHNDAQVMALGARLHTVEQAHAWVEVFLRTPFSEDPRHSRRLAMLTAYEADGTLPPLPEAD
jgi:ribose 5-phosphate isomerase B